MTPHFFFLKSSIFLLKTFCGQNGKKNFGLTSLPVTKRNMFRWCGRMTGHCPVCGWPRPVASWLKRLAKSLTVGWDDPVSLEPQELCSDLQKRVHNEDPVSGAWSDFQPRQWKVWCDASNIAFGVVLEADEAAMEDQRWLRPADDKRHIKVAELDAVM